MVNNSCASCSGTINFCKTYKSDGIQCFCKECDIGKELVGDDECRECKFDKCDSKSITSNGLKCLCTKCEGARVPSLD